MQKFGLDFDGVIQDSRMLKSEYLATKYGVKVDIDICKRSQLVEGGFITSPQYSEMVDELYETEAGLMANSVDGAIESIKRLSEKFELLVVTSRSSQGVEMAKKWLQKYNLETLAVVGTHNQDKSNLLNGFDYYIDDDLEKLLPLAKTVKNCFLFSWKHNQDAYIPSWIKRVSNWQELEIQLKI